MKEKSKKIRIIFLTLILTVISLIWININGKTYTVTVDKVNDLNEVNVEIENDGKFVKCVDKKIENGSLKLKFESVSEGKTFVEIKNLDGEVKQVIILYVNQFGIITYGSYLGDCNGSVIISISVAIIILYTIYLLIKSYKNNMKKSMYQSQNIAYMGLIIFLGFSFINQIIAILGDYKGLIRLIEDAITWCSNFSIVLLPIAFVLSILVIISDAILIKREGFILTNILGLISGIFFCFATIFPNILENFFYNMNLFDIQESFSIGIYIAIFIETLIYIFIAYLETILIGTIIISIKAAKHIPEFDKDFIVVLGCQTKKDGTLTNLLKNRVDRAIEFAKMQKEIANKDIIFVTSGGQGNDEIMSEAQSMKNYLLEQGVKEENILIEDKSKSTYENIKFSYNIVKNIKPDAKVAYSTTNYHVFRTGIIARKQGIDLEGIGAKTKPYFWLNAFIREYIATLFSEKRNHIQAFLNIIIVVLSMIILIYFANLI